MGLLDEAIRDHLELKRRSGADPSEVAREEREALEPVFPDEPRPAALDGEPQAELIDGEPPQGDPLSEAMSGPVAASVHDPSPVDPAAAVPSTLGQETAELDMQAVLDQDARLAEAAAGSGPVGETSASAAQHPGATVDDELLEWEMPARPDDEPPPQPLPGQERLSFE